MSRYSRDDILDDPATAELRQGAGEQRADCQDSIAPVSVGASTYSISPAAREPPTWSLPDPIIAPAQIDIIAHDVRLTDKIGGNWPKFDGDFALDPIA